MTDTAEAVQPHVRTRFEKIMMVVVIVLGIALLAAFAVTVGTIAYRIANPAPKKPKALAEIQLPTNAQLIGTSVDDGRLYLTVRDSQTGKTQVLVADPVTGKVRPFAVIAR